MDKTSCRRFAMMTAAPGRAPDETPRSADERLLLLYCGPRPAFRGTPMPQSRAHRARNAARRNGHTPRRQQRTPPTSINNEHRQQTPTKKSPEDTANKHHRQTPTSTAAKHRQPTTGKHHATNTR